MVNNKPMKNTSTNKVSEHNPEQLDTIFFALSDATRRSFLERLKEGDASVSELANPVSMSLPAVSKHLKVLESAGLIERTKAGRVYSCRLNPAGMSSADEWLSHYREFWSNQLDSLAGYFENKRK